MKKLMVALVLAYAGVALADVSVYDVKVQPRTPWNGLVDVSYSVACDDPNADIYVTPTAYDGDRRITLFPKTLSGDGAEAPIKPGKQKYTMTWDAKKDLGIFSSANFSMKIHAGERLPRYVVIDLSEGANATNYPVRFSVVGPDLSNDICRTTELWLRLVPPGEFWMGSPTDELGRTDNEDLHHVTLTKPFYMGVFEVTQKQWELVMGEKLGYFKDSENADVRPVETVVTGHDGDMIRGFVSPISQAIDPKSFCGRVRARTVLSQFDLPSEARWEYACRAGTMTAIYEGRNLISEVADDGLAQIACYEANGHNNQSYERVSVLVGTRKVGSFRPNVLGLYDMLGNVWEWCLDSAGRGGKNGYHLGNAGIMDPLISDVEWNPGSAYLYYTSRWMRGGGWKSLSRDVRSARRMALEYGSSYAKCEDIGLRVCCEIGF